MFGLTHKLNDSLLYMTHDMTENILSNAKKSIKTIPKENTEEISKLILQIAYYEQEIDIFEKDIAEQRKILFQFSVEELYYMYGQYDKFIGIEFHKFSDSAKKYGRNIGGIIVYGKNERLNLENVINSENITRTNGIIKLDVSSNYNLDEEQTKEILEIGFLSGDIYQILSPNTNLVNSYVQKGKKEIPNTINIDFNPRDTNPCKLILYSLNLRLENGGTLLEEEWDEYFGYNIYYTPEIENVEHIRNKIFNDDGSKKDKVRFYELSAKNLNSNISKNETNEFLILLDKRKIERFQILKEELKKTNINSIEEFKEKHPKIYSEIYSSVLAFDVDVLTFNKSEIPIYWDFKSYLHIYLRHCEELQPNGNFKLKTPFAYNQKDIRRILKIAIEKLESKIQERLTKGLDFRTFGEKALYFNGNYYSLRIENNGRVDSFYPNE